jgi:hypothetical protein
MTRRSHHQSRGARRRPSPPPDKDKAPAAACNSDEGNKICGSDEPSKRSDGRKPGNTWYLDRGLLIYGNRRRRL